MARMYVVDGGRVRLDRVESVEIASVQSHGEQKFKVVLVMMSGNRAYIKQTSREDAIETAKLVCQDIEALP